jgi:hypothetical protein
VPEGCIAFEGRARIGEWVRRGEAGLAEGGGDEVVGDETRKQRRKETRRPVVGGGAILRNGPPQMKYLRIQAFPV